MAPPRPPVGGGFKTAIRQRISFPAQQSHHHGQSPQTPKCQRCFEASSRRQPLL